jgi:hypothetical protein
MKRGYNKIEASRFRDYAAKRLIAGAPWHGVSRELKRRGLDVAPDTVKSFDENFVKKMDEKTIAGFKEKIQKERDLELTEPLVEEKPLLFREFIESD